MLSDCEMVSLWKTPETTACLYSVASSKALTTGHTKQAGGRAGEQAGRQANDVSSAEALYLDGFKRGCHMASRRAVVIP